MHVEVLGPVRVRASGGELTIDGARQRAVLTTLALREHKTASSALLTALLWGDDAPPTAAKSIQTAVSRLRRLLGPTAIRTIGTGYALAHDLLTVDADDFLADAARGRGALDAGDLEEAHAALSCALARWRGGPQLPDSPLGRAEGVRWEELHQGVVEDLVEANLRRGRGADSVADLEPLVAEYPLRERLWAQLMRAYYAAGRQGEALRTYQRARALLADQLGIEPGEELRRVEASVLRGDPPVAGSPATIDRATHRAKSPTGQLTFVFTDIERSTALLLAAGESWPVLLARHHEIVRATLWDLGGSEVGSAGDALFFAFDQPSDAIIGAAMAQRALAAERWPGGHTVAVRMGIHTGQVIETAAGLVGLALHETARVAAAAHGGQILVSGTTASLANADSLGECGLVDLGAYRLRDMPDEVRLHEVSAPWMKVQDRAPRAAGVGRHTLPVALSSFVGREDDLAAVASLLRQHRLVTITGPGGVGKTRVAIEVAREAALAWRDGVVFIDLVPAGPGDIARTAAGALQITERPGVELLDLVIEALTDRSLLLVVDNCEHLVDAAGDFVAAVLRATNAVNVLATSRTPIGPPAEATYRLDPLDVPTTGADREADAHRLFVERAASADPRLEFDDPQHTAVAAICRRLDGLPLGIELAASRARALTPVDIERMLASEITSLDTTSAAVPVRQRNLRLTIAWSYGLLDAADRDVLQRLAVFNGGFGTAGVAAVCGEPAIRRLATLVDWSLVAVDRHGLGHRYRLLEAVREFAREELRAAGLEEDARRRHCEWIGDVAARVHADMRGVAADDALRDALVELDNVRAALDWAAAAGDVNHATTIATHLYYLWFWAGLYVEGSDRLETALAADGADRVVGARAVAAYCYIANYADRDCRAMAEEAARDLEAAGEYSWLALCLVGVGFQLSDLGDQSGAADTFRRAVSAAGRSGDRWMLAESLFWTANELLGSGQLDAAEIEAHEGLAIYRQLESGGSLEGSTLLLVARIAAARGEYTTALDSFDEIADGTRDSGHPRDLLGWTLLNRSLTLMAVGNLDAAEADIAEAREVARSIPDPGMLHSSHVNLAELALRRERFDDARRLLAPALTQAWMASRCAHLRGVIDALAGDHVQGLRLLGSWRHNLTGSARHREIELFDRAVGRATEELGGARVTELLGEGAGLSLDDAVALTRQPATTAP